MTDPSVTVVTVVRNGAATIRDCLESVRGQTVRAEHVVVDGLSTDGTREIVEAAGVARLVSERDSGIYDAMNKGIRLATGGVVGILNADDRYAAPDVLASVLGALADPAYDACYGDLVYVDRDDPRRVVRRWRAGSYGPRSFLWGWMPPHPTFFVRRRVYAEHGLFDTSLGTSADYELMLRLLVRDGVRARYVPRRLVEMRSGGASNATVAQRLAANRMDREAWRRNGLTPLPFTFLAKPIRKVGQFLPWG